MSGVLLRRSQLVSSKGSICHRVESPHIANSRISVEIAPGHMSGRSQEYNLGTQFIDLIFNLSILPLLLISLLTLSINKVTNSPYVSKGDAKQTTQRASVPAPNSSPEACSLERVFPAASETGLTTSENPYVDVKEKRSREVCCTEIKARVSSPLSFV